MDDQPIFEASCHCGRVQIGIEALPEFIMDCNCTLCASHGALWGYYAPEAVRVTGATKPYIRADKVRSGAEAGTILHFCGECGSTVYYAAKSGDAEQRGVNMRLFDPALLKGLPVAYGDGRGWSGEGPWGFRREHGVFE